MPTFDTIPVLLTNITQTGATTYIWQQLTIEVDVGTGSFTVKVTAGYISAIDAVVVVRWFAISQ